MRRGLCLIALVAAPMACASSSEPDMHAEGRGVGSTTEAITAPSGAMDVFAPQPGAHILVAIDPSTGLPVPDPGSGSNQPSPPANRRTAHTLTLPLPSHLQVGERLQMAPIVHTGNSAMVRWSYTITGPKVRGYVQTPQAACVIPFVESTVQSAVDPVPGWHWVQPGTYSVTLSVTDVAEDVADTATVTTQVTVDPPPVQEPIARYEAPISLVNHDLHQQCELLLGYKTPNTFDDNAGDPGFVAYGSGTQGELRWTQLVRMDRSFSSKTQQPINVTTNNTYMLDGDVAYSEGNLASSPSVTMHDSPGLEAFAGQTVTTSDYFHTYMLWKANTAGAIFVPIARVDWSWRGSVSRMNRACQAPVQTRTSISIVDYPEFPEWADNAQTRLNAAFGITSGGSSSSGSSASGSDSSSDSDSTGSLFSPQRRGTDLDFGGAYGSIDNGAPVNNPATGAQSCPEGYDAQQVFGTYGTDWAVFLCVRPHQTGKIGRYDFGGAYGWVSASPSPNTMTGKMSCAPGFQDVRVLGTYNQDWSLDICYREPASGPQVRLGGVVGTVSTQPVVNTVTGTTDCPNGFVKHQVLGTYNTDWPLFVCEATTDVKLNIEGSPWCWSTADMAHRSSIAEPAACPAGYVDVNYAYTDGYCPNSSCTCAAGDWASCYEAHEFPHACPTLQIPWLPVKIRRCQKQ